MPGGHVSLFSLNGLHSSGGGSGRPEEPELPEDEDVFANGDSTQIPVRQQPIESQRTVPGIPSESPHTSPSSRLHGRGCTGSDTRWRGGKHGPLRGSFAVPMFRT